MNKRRLFRKGGNSLAHMRALGVALLLAMLFQPSLTHGQQAITVGNGTTSQNGAPINNYYCYTYSQQLYTAAEISSAGGGPGLITSIAFEYAYSSAMTAKTNCTIYMGHTNKTSFSSSSDYVPVSDLTIVYVGSMNSTGRWTPVYTLRTPFQYDGTRSLVIAVDDNSGSYNSNSYTYYCTNTGSTRALYAYSDSYDAIPSSISSYSGSKTSTTNRPNVRLNMILGCATVSNLQTTTGAVSSAICTWNIASQNGTRYTNFMYRESTTPTWTTDTTSQTTKIMSGLTPGSTYYIKVQPVCSNGDTGMSAFDTITMNACVSQPMQIGNGNGTSIYTPLQTDAYYSLCQQIITANELGNTPNTFTEISFQYASTTPMSAKNICKIRIGHTALSSFASSGFLPDSIFTEVYSGAAISNFVSGWNTIQFSTPFVYNGTDNLVIEVQDSSGADVSNARFYTHSTSGPMTVYFGSYAPTVPLRTMPPNSLNLRSNMKLSYCNTSATCAPPTAMVTNITDNEIDIVWAPGMNETAWTVEYGTSANGPWTFAGRATTPSWNFTNLNSSTPYFFRIGSICANDTMYTTIFDTTECGYVRSFPYTESFETWSASSSRTTPIRQCWLRGTNYNTYSPTSTTTYPYVSTTYASQGSKSMYFYSYYSGYDYSYLATPRMGVPVQGLMVTCDIMNYYSTSYDCPIVIGVMDDGEDYSSFTPIDTIKPNYGTWKTINVPLNSYRGTGRHIAFSAPSWSNNSSYYYNQFYLDNIIIDTIPDCAKPINIQISSIVSNSAVVTWDSSTVGRCHTNSYVLEYKQRSQSSWTRIPVNSNFYFLQGLTAGTQYDIRIKTVCDCNTESDYTTASFTTSSCRVGGNSEFTSAWTTSYYLPVCNGSSAYHSYTQQLYTVAELGGPKRIDSISFRYQGSNPLTAKGNCRIYLGHTSLSVFSGATDFVPLCNLTEVYHDSLRFVRGWNAFALSTPFYYNGYENLVLAVYDSSAATGGTSAVFYMEQAPNKSLYFHSSSNINPSSPTTGSPSYGVYSYRSNVIFHSACNNSTSCVPPNVRTTGSSATTIDVMWAPGGNETSWVVEYRPVGSSIWQGTDTVNITNYTIRNLSAQTRYEIRVGSLCDSVPAYRIVDGTTGCGIISVYPYTEDFERYRGSSSYYQYSPSDQLPDCWDIVNSGSFSHANGDNYCPRIYGGTSTSYLPNNSGKALLLLSNNSSSSSSSYGAATVGRNKYAILPEFADSLPRLTISFKYRMTYTYSSYDYGTLYLGYVVGNDTTFHVIERYYATTSAQDAFVDLAEIPSVHHVPGARLAFRWTQSYNTTSVYYCGIDDVVVDWSATCLRPHDVSDEAIDTVTSMIKWSDGTYIGHTYAYKVVWGPYGIDPDTVMVNMDTVLDTFKILNNLRINTLYHCYVKALCGPDGESKWSFVHTFRTAQNPAQMPYTCRFEPSSLPDNGWTFINPQYGNNAWVIDTAAPSSGNYSMYVSNSAGILNDYQNDYATVSWAYRDIYILPNSGNTYNLKFDWRCDGERSHDYLDVYFGGIASVSANETGILVPPANSIHVGSYSGNGNSFQRETFQIPPMSDTIIRVYFGWVNDANYVGSNPAAAVDNVSLKLNCPEPYNLTVNRVTTNSANISWRSTIGAYTWIVDYRQLGSSQWQSFMVNDTACVLSNLTASSTYEVRVKSMCTIIDTSDDSQVLTFNTSCGNITSFPFYENFDNYGTTNNSFPTCWTYLTQGASRPHCSATTYSSTPASLYFNAGANESAIAVTPRMSVFNPYELEVSFRAFGTATTAYMVVGLMSDSSNISSFVGLDTVFVTRANSWFNHTCDLSAYTGNGQFVAFKVGGSFPITMSIDDVSIDYNGADCSDPTGIGHSSVTTNSAYCFWNEVGPYEFTYRKVGDTAWYPTQTLQRANDANLSNLTDSTMYEWRIRYICANNAGYSHWIYDTVTTFALPCYGISNLTESNITDDGITLSWDADSNQNAWEIHYYDLEWGIDTTIIVTHKPYRLTHLVTGLTYYFSVRSLCTSGLNGGWSDTIEATVAYCKPVKNLSVTPLGPNSVKVSWQVVDPDQYEWELEYGPHGFFENDSTASLIVVTGSNEYTLTRLNMTMCYDVFVRAKCGNGYYSIWTPRQMFQLAVGGSGIDTPDMEGDNSVYLYPNPANDEVSIVMNDFLGDCEISLIDITGRTQKVRHNTNTETHTVVTMDISNMTRGTYFVKITNGENSFVRKLVIQ